MINNIRQLTAGIYADAVRSEAEHGLAYVNLNGHLAQMAQAGDFETGMIRDDLLNAGISPVRQLLAGAGIRLGGLRASMCSVFFRGSPDYVAGADVLLPALMQDMFESALGIQAAGDLSFQSRPGVAGDTVYPVDIRTPADQRVPIPESIVTIDDLVSVTFGIDGDGYKSARIIAERGSTEMGRVAEGAVLPLYTVSTADRAVSIFKYGGRIKWTYEARRRQRINQLQIFLEQMAQDEDIRRRKDALRVAVNGDGNGNGMILAGVTPPSHSIQNLDEWGIDVASMQSLGLTMYVTDGVELKNIRALRYTPTGQVVLNPLQLAMYGGPGYQMPDGSPLRLAPAGSVLQGAKTVLGWNPARALEQVVENGSQISEQDRTIQNQTEELTVSINIGYGKPYDNSFQAFARA